MSLVGPRPLPIYEVKQFEAQPSGGASMKPGLTCLWQVSGRNEVKSFDDWVKLDLEYIDNWSLWLDFKILRRPSRWCSSAGVQSRIAESHAGSPRSGPSSIGHSEQSEESLTPPGPRRERSEVLRLLR